MTLTYMYSYGDIPNAQVDDRLKDVKITASARPVLNFDQHRFPEDIRNALGLSDPTITVTPTDNGDPKIRVIHRADDLVLAVMLVPGASSHYHCETYYKHRGYEVHNRHNDTNPVKGSGEMVEDLRRMVERDPALKEVHAQMNARVLSEFAHLELSEDELGLE